MSPTPRRRPVTDRELENIAGLPVDVLATYMVARALMERSGGRVCPDDPKLYRVLEWIGTERVQQAILFLCRRGFLDTGDGYLTVRRGALRHG